MNTIELKRSFHSLIDSIDNDCLLMNFYDLMKTKTLAKEGQLWNRLTEDEQEKLLMTLEESENPESLIRHEEMKHKIIKSLFDDL